MTSRSTDRQPSAHYPADPWIQKIKDMLIDPEVSRFDSNHKVLQSSKYLFQKMRTTEDNKTTLSAAQNNAIKMDIPVNFA